MMNTNLQPLLDVRVDPVEMIRYVNVLMSKGHFDGGSQLLAQAAQLRWDALNRALGDERLGSWTLSRRSDQIHVPAALIAAAGVASLKLTDDEVVFDIPTLLDATLQLCEPVGHA
jgi:hypothetical protein